MSKETNSDYRKNANGPPPVSRDIQLRTLKVSNLHERVSKDSLKELFIQAGPIRNVVHRTDFAFIEFEDEESVPYALALMEKLSLFGKELILAPKIYNNNVFKYVNELRNYETQIASNPAVWWQKFGRPDKPIPRYLCSEYLDSNQKSLPYSYTHAHPQRIDNSHHAVYPVVASAPSAYYPPSRNYVPEKVINYDQPRNSHYYDDKKYDKHGSYHDHRSKYSSTRHNDRKRKNNGKSYHSHKSSKSHYR